ncbi:hypothetical protein [Xanthomonas sacchari]|uniref:hypothetical protein n=1 Tax=Xanthomonas sacchari TaxID=56458 RepID=UPI00266B7E07|nr:hypothetical protein [Xanthomonas sacchari]
MASAALSVLPFSDINLDKPKPHLTLDSVNLAAAADKLGLNESSGNCTCSCRTYAIGEVCHHRACRGYVLARVHQRSVLPLQGLQHPLSVYEALLDMARCERIAEVYEQRKLHQAGQ